MTFYEFAGMHPYLTFFLALIAGETIVRGILAVRGIATNDE